MQIERGSSVLECGFTHRNRNKLFVGWWCPVGKKSNLGPKQISLQVDPLVIFSRSSSSFCFCLFQVRKKKNLGLSKICVTFSFLSIAPRTGLTNTSSTCKAETKIYKLQARPSSPNWLLWKGDRSIVWEEFFKRNLVFAVLMRTWLDPGLDSPESEKERKKCPRLSSGRVHSGPIWCRNGKKMIRAKNYIKLKNRTLHLATCLIFKEA